MTNVLNACKRKYLARIERDRKESAISDRQIIGLLSLLIGGGVVFVSMVSRRFAHGVTNFVDHYLGVGNFTSAILVVMTLMLMIAVGIKMFFSKAK